MIFYVRLLTNSLAGGMAEWLERETRDQKEKSDWHRIPHSANQYMITQILARGPLYPFIEIHTVVCDGNETHAQE